MDAKRKFHNVAFSQASDAPQMSQYLHAMYEEQGLLMGSKSPVPECKTGRIGLLHVFRALLVGLSRAISALRPVSVPPPFHSTASPTSDQTMLTELRVQGNLTWAHLILGAGLN
jgi:hypothetical protein